MAVRYNIAFKDLEGVSYTGEIAGDTTQPTQFVEGRFSMGNESSNDIYQPIQATIVDIELAASIAQPLEDLFNEEDRFWSFTLRRNQAIIFRGYISTENMQEPFNSARWNLSFEARGHLSYLENFGYYTAAGLRYIGIAPVSVILANAFARVFNDGDAKMVVFASHYLSYNNGSIFSELYLNQDQFYDEDGEAQDCKTIVEDVLKSIGCTVRQYNGRLYVIAVEQWKQLIDAAIPVVVYNEEGNFIATSEISPDAENQIIGSDVKDFKTYHVNKNAGSIRRNFYNTFRVNHVFITKDNVFSNPELDNDGASIEGWQLFSGAELQSSAVRLTGTVLSFDIILQSEVINLSKGDSFDLEIQLMPLTSENDGYRLEFVVALIGVNNTYRLVFENTTDRVTWAKSGDEFYENRLFKLDTNLPNSTETLTNTFTTPLLPEDGALTVGFNPPRLNNTSGNAMQVDVLSVQLNPLTNPIESETVTATRTDTTAGKIPDVYEVRFNTVERNILTNIFLDAAGEAIAGVTNGNSTFTTAEFLTLEFIRNFSATYRVFTGSVYNNLGFTPKRIDGLEQFFIALSDTKDLKTNVSGLLLQQIPEVPEGFSINLITDRKFTNVIEPTIV